MNNEYWYKELKSHIQAIHSKDRKTILITGPHFYQVVTRVNNLTTKLWINHINEIIKANPEFKREPIKINWVTEQKKYRREIDNEIELKKCVTDKDYFINKYSHTEKELTIFDQRFPKYQSQKNTNLMDQLNGQGKTNA